MAGMIMMVSLAVLSGALVGFSLGLVGGGGSILATPLLLYIVGVSDPHIAIGTSAVAVSMNAYLNFLTYLRSGVVRRRTAVIFAGVGSVGALGGSSLGKAFDANRLIFLFGILMVVVGAIMLRPRRRELAEKKSCGQSSLLAQIAVALTVGILSGFFGIGGGFLIVPGLVFSTGMPMINAIGSSLLAVGTFGLTTAANYAASGLVNWPVAAEFVAGGVLGGLGGVNLAGRLAHHKNALHVTFACLIFLVAAYVLWRSGRILLA